LSEGPSNTADRLHNLLLFFLPCEGCAFASEVGKGKRQVFELKALCLVGAFRAVLKNGRELVSCARGEAVSGMASVACMNSGLDRASVGGCKNSLVAVAVITAVGVGGTGCVVAVHRRYTHYRINLLFASAQIVPKSGIPARLSHSKFFLAKGLDLRFSRRTWLHLPPQPCCRQSQ